MKIKGGFVAVAFFAFWGWVGLDFCHLIVLIMNWAVVVVLLKTKKNKGAVRFGGKLLVLVFIDRFCECKPVL